MKPPTAEGGGQARSCLYPQSLGPPSTEVGCGISGIWSLGFEGDKFLSEGPESCQQREESHVFSSPSEWETSYFK